jgi:hypothetical protein
MHKKPFCKGFLCIIILRTNLSKQQAVSAIKGNKKSGAFAPLFSTFALIYVERLIFG